MSVLSHSHSPRGSGRARSSLPLAPLLALLYTSTVLVHLIVYHLASLPLGPGFLPVLECIFVFNPNNQTLSNAIMTHSFHHTFCPISLLLGAFLCLVCSMRALITRRLPAVLTTLSILSSTKSKRVCLLSLMIVWCSISTRRSHGSQTTHLSLFCSARVQPCQSAAAAAAAAAASRGCHPHSPRHPSGASPRTEGTGPCGCCLALLSSTAPFKGNGRQDRYTKARARAHAHSTSLVSFPCC